MPNNSFLVKRIPSMNNPCIPVAACLACGTRQWMVWLGTLGVLLCVGAARAEPNPPEAKRLFPPQCRVAIVGSALVELAGQHGYWEAALRVHLPDRRLRVRNLGWGGDTVFGEARAEFGTPEDGYRRLLEQVALVRPQVVLVIYGQNESFAGPEDLVRFGRGVQRLLQDLETPKRKAVVVLPPRIETVSGLPPLEWQRQYIDTLRRQARQRQLPVVNWFEHPLLLSAARAGHPLRSNGLQLTALGYWYTAAALVEQLGLSPAGWEVEIALQGNTARLLQARGTQVSSLQWKDAALAFGCRDAQLPPPAAPRIETQGKGSSSPSWPGYQRRLRIRGLPSGRWRLLVGDRQVAVARADQWAAGVLLVSGPEWEQTEQLRRLVIQKNRWFLHRWRPQNTTYLFGFRKHEQGHNAREVPQFDPLVERLDRQLDRLQRPRLQRYRLERVR